MKEKKTVSPMMQQYLKIKEEHKDKILLFRMGDFYEMFFEDAKICSRDLGIVLTKRGSYEGSEIPMSGIPVSTYQSYLEKLLKLNHKVAICEQIETPEQARKRDGYKAVVQRDIVRIITPGTILEDSSLEVNTSNFLAAMYVSETLEVVISYIDLSTGEFFYQEAVKDDLSNIIYKINPKEILVLKKHKQLLNMEDVTLTEVEPERTNLTYVEELFKQFYPNSLDKYISIEKSALVSIGMILMYIKYTCCSVPKVLLPKKETEEGKVRLDLFTQKSLELVRPNNLKGETLKSTIDFTKTSSGSRLLEKLILNPLTDIEKIKERQQAIEFFINNEELLSKITDLIKGMPDVERALSKINLNIGNISNIFAVRRFLNTLVEIRLLFIHQEPPKILSNILDDFGNNTNLLGHLTNAFIPDETLNSANNYINHGFNPALDKALSLSEDAVLEINKLKEKYVFSTQVSNLKIVFNNILGYFIEVPLKKQEVLQSNSIFIHKQTLTNIARYTTEEIINLETEISEAKKLSEQLQNQIFSDAVSKIKESYSSIMRASSAFAMIDVLCGLTVCANSYNLVKPSLSLDSHLDIKDGRHIVVEKGLQKSSSRRFISNDCIIQNKSFAVITGPNMAGKSTYLRQNALIILMAQIGSYVPASSAKIGVVDAIFSRVGASDDLFKGQSTFMVEMLELAVILNNSTSKSFLILDEVGRGTSTYDGLSIAWSTIEHLTNIISPRCLFATHYHELTDLEKTNKKVDCYYVDIKEHENDIIFMHNIKKGVFKRSYGIQVAKIAGVPLDIINRSTDILNSLENNKKTIKPQDLFEYQEQTKSIEKDNNSKAIITALKQIDADSLSPKQALEVLYNLKKIVKENN